MVEVHVLNWHITSVFNFFFCQTTGGYIPEDGTLHSQYYETFRSPENALTPCFGVVRIGEFVNFYAFLSFAGGSYNVNQKLVYFHCMLHMYTSQLADGLVCNS
jgi:hypothetical protein